MPDLEALKTAWIAAENDWLLAYREAASLREKADKAKQRWVDAALQTETNESIDQ